MRWNRWGGDHHCSVCAAEVRHDDELHARDVLRLALYALPRRKGRGLRQVVRRCDRQVLDKTLPDPQLPGDLPWWRRRIPRASS